MNFLADPQQLFATILALLVGLTLHEYMHAFAGHKLGDPTAEAEGRLTLNPAAHIDPFTTLLLPLGLILIGSPIVFAAAKPVPFNPWMLSGGRRGAAIQAAAGPFTNLVIAIIAAVLFQVLPYSAYGATILGTMIVTNVALFVFNMIPFPPLDGSRVLYAFAPEGLRNGMDRIEQAGLAAIAFFILILYATPLGNIVNRLILGVVGLLVPGQPGV